MFLDFHGLWFLNDRGLLNLAGALLRNHYDHTCIPSQTSEQAAILITIGVTYILEK